MNRNNYIILVALLLSGAYMRFAHLMDKPLWVDESWIAFQVRDFNLIQEYPFIILGKLFHLEGESLRWISAISGFLTIPAMYWVIPDKKKALIATTIVATFPLFVFWSRMARPYALAGLLMVIGWRYWWSWLLAVTVTPIAVIGFPLTRKRLWVIPVVAVIALGVFFLRPDSNRDFFNWQFITNNARIFYLPCLALILYTFTWEKK